MAFCFFFKSDIHFMQKSGICAALVSVHYMLLSSFCRTLNSRNLKAHSFSVCREFSAQQSPFRIYRKSNSSFGVISSTSQSLNITSKDTPTFPSSMALMWLRSISTSSASCNCVSFFVSGNIPRSIRIFHTAAYIPSSMAAPPFRIIV